MKIFSIVFYFLLISQSIYSKQTNTGFLQLKVYHLKSDEQIILTDKFLKNSYLPTLHRLGIKNIGVFKPIANDTAKTKLIYVLILFSSPDQWMKISDRIKSDAAFKLSAKSFLEANAKDPPFERVESILMEAFPGQPDLAPPQQKDTERVFELRSYESPTMHLAEKKMRIFKKDEIGIFKRLKFNPVFYGKVVSGSRMPNLMYMPIFKNIEDRNEQWTTFRADTKWKEISTDPKNEPNVLVSHIDSILMHSTSYSDY